MPVRQIATDHMEECVAQPLKERLPSKVYRDQKVRSGGILPEGKPHDMGCVVAGAIEKFLSIGAQVSSVNVKWPGRRESRPCV